MAESLHERFSMFGAGDDKDSHQFAKGRTPLQIGVGRSGRHRDKFAPKAQK
jgi:hypothetical protein